MNKPKDKPDVQLPECRILAKLLPISPPHGRVQEGNQQRKLALAANVVPALTLAQMGKAVMKGVSTSIIMCSYNHVVRARMSVTAQL